MDITFRIGGDFNSHIGRYDSGFGGAHKTPHSPVVHDPYDIQDGTSGVDGADQTAATDKAQKDKMQKAVALLMMILMLLKQMMNESGDGQNGQGGEDKGVQSTKAGGSGGGKSRGVGGSEGAGGDEGSALQAVGEPQAADNNQGGTPQGTGMPLASSALRQTDGPQNGTGTPGVEAASPPSGTTATGGGGGLSAAALANNPAIATYGSDIATASSLTGVPAEHIGATIWAESRGNQHTSTTNPGDGHADVGLMQISQNTWDHDVMPNLSAQDKANIKAATGKDASQLNMNDAHDNIIGGSFHLRDWINRAGGDLDRGHGGYVGGNLNNGGSIYVQNINAYVQELQNGQKLHEDPAGQAGRLG